MARTPYTDKNGLKKGTWTAEEDMRLAAYVAAHGCRNWRRLPKYAGLARCGKSCRLRWLNYLRPDIKRGNFTKEEEAAIVALHESLGNKWSIIATHLPGRTDNEIKNYWNTHVTKKSQPKPATTTDAAQPIVCSSSSSNVDAVSHQQQLSEIISTSIGHESYHDNISRHEITDVEVVSTPQINEHQYCLSLPQMSAESSSSLSPTTGTDSPNSNSGSSVLITNDFHQCDFGGDFWSQPCLLVDAADEREIYSTTTIDDDQYFGLHNDYMLWLHYGLHNELVQGIV
ncbi:unnamed protein product [Linum tenue]|uniref:Uncharacterized protein n=2 Tax=Linum tenue TaxID=586396 RepID=A0AAV0R123_9ROSI|nr:unnamed protein product [Linum tenue]